MGAKFDVYCLLWDFSPSYTCNMSVQEDSNAGYMDQTLSEIFVNVKLE